MHDSDFPEYEWETPEWMAGKVFVCNPHIASYAKISPEELSDRLRNVRALRRGESPRYLSYYIADGEDWPAWENLHALVHGKGMRYSDGQSRTCFGSFLPPAIHKWLLNNPLPTIQRQITLYLATLYASDPSKQQIMREQIHALFLPDIKNLAATYYAKLDVDEVDIWSTPYLEASEDFIGSAPPPILFQGASYMMPKDKQREWGIDRADEFYINVGFAYMTGYDWKSIVLRDKNTLARDRFRDKLRDGQGYKHLSAADKKSVDALAEQSSEDNLYRSESDPKTYQLWLQACRNFVRESSPTYEPLGKNTDKGFVYLVRDESGMIKIGFSKNVSQRLANLNTGSAQKIELITAFPVSSAKAEKALHRFFETKRRKLEWFQLSDDEINSISCQSWRSENGIY